MVTSIMRRYNSLSISSYLRLTTTSLFGGGGGVAPPTTSVGVIGNRFGVGSTLNTGTAVTGYTSRRHHYAHPDGSVTDIKCVDAHWYMALSPAVPPVSRQHKRYIEYPIGVFHQVSWAGQPTLTLTSGSYVSDVVLSSVTGLPLIIPAGAKFWERTVNTGPSLTAGQLPVFVMPAGNGVLGTGDGNSTTDLGNSGTIAQTATLYTNGCVAMIGTINYANARSFLLFGDSIVFGEGDVSSTGPKGGSGWPARLLDVRGYPYMKIATQGQTSAQATGGGTSLLANLAAVVPFSEVISEHGGNDLRLATPPAQLLLDYQLAYSRFPGRVINQTTTQPRSSSTDGYATTINQTPKTDGTMGQVSTLNASVRAGLPGVTRVLDASDAACPSRDANIWTAASTLDGSHPTSTKCAAMAAYLAPQLEL